MYSYSNSRSDIGNSEELKNEAPLHLSFFFKAIRRVMKPGRVMMVHCQQIVRMKRTGQTGLFDFRGLLIRLAQRAGFIYDYDWLIKKNPQSAAIRTKSRALQFAGLESNRLQSRGVNGDYLIKFVVPGDSSRVVDEKDEISRDNWIDWAEAAWWDDIIETDTLNTAAAKSESDIKHIAPLQLEVIRRCVLLYTNPGEIVFSPFAGIGSEGYMAVGGKSPKTGKSIFKPRRFYGIELKPEYYEAAKINLERAVLQASNNGQATLLDMLETE